MHAVVQDKADALMGDPVIREVLGNDALIALLEALMGEQVVAFDHKWFRLVLPGGQTPFHMDSVFFGRSQRAGPLDADGLHTVWLPWNDLPAEAGGLLLLEGSHRLPGFDRCAECSPDFAPFLRCCAIGLTSPLLYCLVCTPMPQDDQHVRKTV